MRARYSIYAEVVSRGLCFGARALGLLLDTLLRMRKAPRALIAERHLQSVASAQGQPLVVLGVLQFQLDLMKKRSTRVLEQMDL